MRKSVIHGDFHTWNMIVEDNKLKAVIDWGDAHEDYLIQEIAVFAAHGFVTQKDVNTKGMQKYFEIFERTLKLRSEEKKQYIILLKNVLLEQLLGS